MFFIDLIKFIFHAINGFFAKEPDPVIVAKKEAEHTKQVIKEANDTIKKSNEFLDSLDSAPSKAELNAMLDRARTGDR